MPLYFFEVKGVSRMSNEEKAIAYFELYTRLMYDPTNIRHRVIVSDMAQFMTNTSDNLGLQSISINGVSESNMSIFPDFIMRGLDRLTKKVKFL